MLSERGLAIEGASANTSDAEQIEVHHTWLMLML